MNEVNTKQMFSDIIWDFLKKGNYDGIPEFLDKLLERGQTNSFYVVRLPE